MQSLIKLDNISKIRKLMKRLVHICTLYVLYNYMLQLKLVVLILFNYFINKYETFNKIY